MGRSGVVVFPVVDQVLASITETDLGNPSAYWVDLTGAVAMLGVPRAAET